MRELTIQEIKYVSGGAEWGEIGGGAALVGLAIGVAAVPGAIVLGTVGGTIALAGAVVSAYGGGVSIGDGFNDCTIFCEDDGGGS